MKSLPIGPFRGLNNRIPDFATVTKEGAWLPEAVNVDIDNAGRVRRRDGTTLVQAMTAAHSVLQVTETTGYLVRSGVLYSFTTDPAYSETLVKVLSNDNPMYYQHYNSSNYCSNGTDALRLVGDTAYQWGMATPAAISVSTVGGGLFSGRYQVSVRYINNITGEAGGLSEKTQHEVAADGSGLRVTLPGAFDGATHVQVFVSTQNGSQVYLHSTHAIGGATTDIMGIDNLTTTGEDASVAPLPAGHSPFVHMGRLCSIVGSRLYYGLPFRLGYYDPLDGYIDFEADIQLAIPCQTGVYVVTSNQTHWLPGQLGKVEMLLDPLPYGGIKGTRFLLPHKKQVGWFGDNGFVIADEQGQVQPVMQDAVDVTHSGEQFVAVLSNRGYRRVVCNGYCMNVDNMAVTTYADFGVTSASGLFATKADGLYLLTGSEAVDAYVSLGKHAFGSEELKRMPTAYLGVASETPARLRVRTADGDDYTYVARSSSEDLRVQRVDVGKGLLSNWYGLSVYNSEGSDFTLASVSFAPFATGRKI